MVMARPNGRTAAVWRPLTSGGYNHGGRGDCACHDRGRQGGHDSSTTTARPKGQTLAVGPGPAAK